MFVFGDFVHYLKKWLIMPELVMDMSVVCCCLFIPDALLDIISLQNEHPNIKKSLIRNSIQARCLLNLKKGHFFFPLTKISYQVAFYREKLPCQTTQVMSVNLTHVHPHKYKYRKDIPTVTTLKNNCLSQGETCQKPEIKKKKIKVHMGISHCFRQLKPSCIRLLLKGAIQ